LLARFVIISIEQDLGLAARLLIKNENDFEQMSFCQFGGHDSNKTPRAGSNLITIQHDMVFWNLCNECKMCLEGDPNYGYPFTLGREVSDISQLPTSLTE
jgi:hypothetical protein